MRKPLTAEPAAHKIQLAASADDWDLFVIHLPEDPGGFLRGVGSRLQSQLTPGRPASGPFEQGRWEAQLALASGLHAAYDANSGHPNPSTRYWEGEPLPLDADWDKLARLYLPGDPAAFFDALSRHLEAGMASIRGWDRFSRGAATEFGRCRDILLTASWYCRWALDGSPANR